MLSVQMLTVIGNKASRENMKKANRPRFPRRTTITVTALLVGILLSLVAAQYFLNNPTRTQPKGLAIQWNTTFPIGTSITAMFQTSDNNYAVFGNFDSNGWMAYVDSNGNPKWNKTYNIGTIREAIQTRDHGYAFAGSVNPDSSNTQIWLGKTDSLGNLEWSQTFLPSKVGYPNGLVQMENGGYAVSGTILDYTSNIWSAFILRVDSNGALQSHNIYPKSTIVSMIKTYNQSLILASQIVEPNQVAVQQLIEVDSTGTVQWNHTIDNALVFRMLECPDGFLLTGDIRKDNKSYMALIKTDLNGKELWTKSYDGSSAFAFVQTSDGFLIAGSNAYGRFASDGWLVKTDLAGNRSWSQNYTDCSEFVDIISTSDSGYLLASTVYLPMYEHSSLLIKTR